MAGDSGSPEVIFLIVIIRSALKQDSIRDLLDGGTFKGVGLSFVGKKGIELSFNASGDDLGSLDVVSIVKSVIKASDFGKGIMFSVVLR